MIIKEKSKDADQQRGPKIGEILVPILSDTVVMLFVLPDFFP